MLKPLAMFDLRPVERIGHAVAARRNAPRPLEKAREVRGVEIIVLRTGHDADRRIAGRSALVRQPDRRSQAPRAASASARTSPAFRPRPPTPERTMHRQRAEFRLCIDARGNREIGPGAACAGANGEFLARLQRRDAVGRQRDAIARNTKRAADDGEADGAAFDHDIERRRQKSRSPRRPSGDAGGDVGRLVRETRPWDRPASRHSADSPSVPRPGS